MNEVKTCVLYARLSVTKEESVSIDRQLEAGRKYAELRSWKVLGEFVDDGVSATANRPEDRKGWGDLMRAHGFDAVIVWKVDRLARRVLDFLQVDQALQERGAGLVAVEDPIDMTTPMGRAFATILAVFGEMEAAAIASRVKAARAHLVKEGRWTGGGYLYGLMPIDNPDGAGKVLTHDPERIEWLRLIVRMAQRGETVSAITTYLDTHGAPLPVKAERGGRKWSGWNRQTVAGILRNPSLAGATPRNPGRKKSNAAASPLSVVRDNDGKPRIDADIAIVTFEEFEALLKQLNERSSPQARPFSERKRTSPLLSRIATCDECDVFMMRGTNQQKAVLYCRICRQTISRSWLDPYITDRLLSERRSVALGDATVEDQWKRGWANDKARRDVLASQVQSLRIKRGVVGRRFDPDRVLLTWKTSGKEIEKWGWVA